MSNYERDAREHADKIRYFHLTAGSRGYDQAQYYYDQLSTLIGRAYRSKEYQHEVSLIQSFQKDVEPLMQEMKNRKLNDV